MNTLLVTVGGSHQPIKESIDTLSPDFVIFICSDDDPGTGRKGSYQSVKHNGFSNYSSRKLEKPDLPDIVTLTDLSEEQFDIIKLANVDDLGEIYKKITGLIALRKQDQLIADFTGGTKAMSAALAMAATDYNLDINLVTGLRDDHIKVKDGTQESSSVNVQDIRHGRQLRQAASYWANHAYSQTDSALANMTTQVNDQGKRKRLQIISRAFAEWDRFNHDQALALLDPYKAKIGQHFKQAPYLTVLRHLADATDPNKPDTQLKYTPYLLIDLYHNACRKAAQGYFDDAVSRTYRLMEWSAQWLLKLEKGWASGNLPEEACLPGINITTNRQGALQAGLHAAWQLVQNFGSQNAQEFANKQLDTMQNHLVVRNQSILAHGYAPISQQQWEPLLNWINGQLLPLIQAESGQKLNDFQLPTEYPEELL